MDAADYLKPGEHLCTSRYKRRFMHIRRDGESNTVCGAMPHFYGAGHLDRVTSEEAARMHRCKSCFKEGR